MDIGVEEYGRNYTYIDCLRTGKCIKCVKTQINANRGE